MARVLIIGGGARGRWLAQETVRDGNVARVVTRDRAGEDAIASTGAECWIGDPSRLATIVGALDSVAVACWLLAGATGTPDELEALHGSLLEAFLNESVDTTMRGFVYEAAGTVPVDLLQGGSEVARRIAEANAIPLQTIAVPAAKRETWEAAARAAVSALIS